MSADPHITQAPHGSGIGSYKSYGLGYILCVIATLVAYFFVTESVFSGWALMISVVALGVFQFVIQMILFIHLHSEKKPRWNTILFFFMLVLTAIVVIGSLWIMSYLDYRVMAPM